MTEQEIINYLKENKNKGVAFGFMPEDVQDWVQSHHRECVYLNADGMWEETTRHTSDIKDIWASDICALAESYLLSKKGGEWVEFEIDKDGLFRVVYEDDEQYACYYDWFYWQLVLVKSKEIEDRNRITAFGGWQYNNASDEWYMTPKVDSYNHNCHCYCSQYKGSEKNIIPAIPIKIRFWREIK